MSKPYTDADFSAQIAQDRNWRLKEISDLKSAAKSADAQLSRVLLRSLVAICYAHFEGHTRFAARKYLQHVSLRKHQYAHLNRQFYRNLFLPRLSGLAKSQPGASELCLLIDQILDSTTSRFSQVDDKLINTKSNLNSSVLIDICQVCAIQVKQFQEKSDFVDIFLLKRRNEIAHGEETFIELDDLDRLTQGTVELMRLFGDALENQVYLKAYKADQPLASSKINATSDI